MFPFVHETISRHKYLLVLRVLIDFSLLLLSTLSVNEVYDCEQ